MKTNRGSVTSCVGYPLAQRRKWGHARRPASENVPFLKLPTKRPPRPHPADFESEIAISEFKPPSSRANETIFGMDSSRIRPREYWESYFNSEPLLGKDAGPRVTQTRVQESPTAKKMSQRAAHRQPADSPVPQRRYQTAGKHISDRCCSIYDCRFCRGPGKSTSVSECRHRHADSLRGDGVTFVFDRPAVVVRLAINGSPADGICLLGLCDQSH